MFIDHAEAFYKTQSAEGRLQKNLAVGAIQPACTQQYHANQKEHCDQTATLSREGSLSNDAAALQV